MVNTQQIKHIEDPNAGCIEINEYLSVCLSI